MTLPAEDAPRVAWAEAYAAAGYAVLPIFPVRGGRCACGKECASPGKHPIASLVPHGLKDASRDATTVRRWFAGVWADANIAIAAGPKSGIVVLDIDPRNGGSGSFEQLAGEIGPLPVGPRALTGGGGEHVYFRHPGGHVAKVTGFRPGLDLQADESYVLAPPSNHASGGVYRWARPPNGSPPPLVPAKLLAAAERPRDSPAPRPAIKTAGGKVPHGKHHDALTRLAASLASKLRELNEDQLLVVVRSAAAPIVDDLAGHERELRDLVRSAFAKYGGASTASAVAPAALPDPRAPSPSSKPIAVVPFGDRGQVEHLPDRIEWVKPLQKGEIRSPVVDGEVRVRERLRVDSEEYYRVEISGSEKLEQATTFFDTLRRRGMVLDRSRGMDALAGILRYETRGRTREGHAALGVYAKANGTLELCTDPVPLSDEQAEVVESAKIAVSYAATATDVSAYFDLMGRFEPEEWGPVAGMGAIAALTLPLRERMVLVPHLFAHSTASGVGKTTLATAFGETLFGRRGVMAEAIGSEFRFASLLDAGLPLVVNEGERIDQTRFGGALKDSAERSLFSKRGTKDLGHRNYLARSPLFMTGNRFPFEARAVRVRFLAPWHDPLRQRERHRPEARRQLDEILGRLRPIGFALTRSILERYGSVGDLLGAVTSARMDLEGSSSSYNWRDPRRSGAWALVLLGIRAWADLGKKHGVAFPYADLLAAGSFFERVVVPVDRATFESEADPIDRFRNWLAGWRAANVRSSRTLDVRSDSAGRENEHVTFEEKAKGEGDLFEDALLEVDGRKVRGTWVSAPVLETYNRVQSIEFQIAGINDLARQSADAAGISRSVLLDLKSDARNHTYENGRKRRSAFLAEEGAE